MKLNTRLTMKFNSKLDKKLMLLGLTIVFACIISLVLYRQGILGPHKVVTVKSETGTLNPTVFGIGTVQAKSIYNIGPTQTSRILKLYVDQGDLVKAGQVIGKIDPIDLEQNINSSKAALISSQHDAEAAKAKIQDAKSQNDLAQTEVVRYKKLFASDAISKEMLESKQNNAAVAEASLASATSDFNSAQSKVDQAAADYQAKLAQKKNLLLVSPVDGVVASREVEAGSTVTAGETVFMIIDPKTLWVQTRIDQTRFRGIALGQKADIVSRSDQGTILMGTVERLEVQGDTITEERFVDVKFDHAPASIFLADLAHVTIHLPEVVDALYIPAIAIKSNNNEEGVWVAENGKAYYKAVKTGMRTTEGQVQIVAGLDRNETIILKSNAQLAEGASVRSVPTL